MGVLLLRLREEEYIDVFASETIRLFKSCSVLLDYICTCYKNFYNYYELKGGKKMTDKYRRQANEIAGIRGLSGQKRKLEILVSELNGPTRWKGVLCRMMKT